MHTIIISVGGSIIVPEDVDYKFLAELRNVIAKISLKHKIVICTGGGSTARRYISVLKKAGATNYIQDTVGIDATRLNARLVATFLSTNALIRCNTEVPKSLEEIKFLLKTHNVVVCGGLRPGQTSDGTTVEIAEYLDSPEMINLTNVKGLFTKDPKKHRDAKFIPRISHADFTKLMEKVKAKPGQHFVLDAVAEEIARKNCMKVVILKGASNLEGYVEAKGFEGTVVQ